MSDALARVELVSPGLSHIASEIHAFATCCFCKSPLVKLQSHWWCAREACRDIQRRYSIAFQHDDGSERFWHVPLPKQALVEMQTAPNVMYAGAAGPGKSHWGRRRLTRRAMAYENYKGIIARRVLEDITATHGAMFKIELKELAAQGIESKQTEKYVEFKETGGVIHFGHLATEASCNSTLGPEYDDILIDEASTINPKYLRAIMARARTTNPAVLADGGAKALPVTNPGGEGALYLCDMFIDHAPDFDNFPQLREAYNPDEWIYIEATLDDNPYLPPDYAQKRLANLDPVTYRQQRFADWKTFDGQFFSKWREAANGLPWNVQEVELA